MLPKLCWHCWVSCLPLPAWKSPGDLVMQRGGAGGSDQLRRMVIPAPPDQARGNVKGGGVEAVILAVGSAHPKGSVFWRQMPGYQSMCREGRSHLSLGHHCLWAPLTTPFHTGQARKCWRGANHPGQHLRASLALACVPDSRGVMKKI